MQNIFSDIHFSFKTALQKGSLIYYYIFDDATKVFFEASLHLSLQLSCAAKFILHMCRMPFAYTKRCLTTVGKESESLFVSAPNTCFLPFCFVATVVISFFTSSILQKSGAPVSAAFLRRKHSLRRSEIRQLRCRVKSRLWRGEIRASRV